MPDDFPTPEETTRRNPDGSIHAPVRVGVGSGTAWVDLKPGQPGYSDFDAFLGADEPDPEAGRRKLLKAAVKAHQAKG